VEVDGSNGNRQTVEWAKFNLPPAAEQLFLPYDLGDGTRFQFWKDTWLEGRSVTQIAPDLIKFITPSLRRISVREALPDDNWIRAIRGTPTVPALAQFLELTEILGSVELTDNVEDSVTWHLSPNKCYSAKSAYNAFFYGRIEFAGAKELWSSGAPLKHKIHVCLNLRDRLWTADRLQRRGLDHPDVCPICCQEQETASHLTLQCPFSRQIWHDILLLFGLQAHTPDSEASIAHCWLELSSAMPDHNHREINSLIVLVARALWLKRNSRVFDKFATMPMEVCRKICAEFDLWKVAKICGLTRGLRACGCVRCGYACWVASDQAL
jgi:hypothetical protein